MCRGAGGMLALIQQGVGSIYLRVEMLPEKKKLP